MNKEVSQRSCAEQQNTASFKSGECPDKGMGEVAVFCALSCSADVLRFLLVASNGDTNTDTNTDTKTHVNIGSSLWTNASIQIWNAGLRLRSRHIHTLLVS